MIEQEEWRPVRGFEGLYEASSLGRIRSLARTVAVNGDKNRAHTRTYSASIRKPHLRKSGYLDVSLWSEGRQHNRYLHVWICEAFHGERPAGLEVAHNDGNSLNCSARNLRWDTPKSNTADKWAHGTMLAGATHPLAKLTDEMVREIRSTKGATHKQIAAKFGISCSQVSRIRKRARWGDDGQAPSTDRMSRKLSSETVSEIRAASGLMHRELAERYGVSRVHITNIRSGNRRA
jgi:hypothetical protein